MTHRRVIFFRFVYTPRPVSCYRREEFTNTTTQFYFAGLSPQLYSNISKFRASKREGSALSRTATLLAQRHGPLADQHLEEMPMADRSLAHLAQDCARSPAMVEALLHKSGDVIVEAMFRRAMTAPVGTNQHSDNVTTLKPERGNSRAYTLDRLQRERPELFAQAEAGKLSANAAAIQAGFRKKLTPFERVQKLLPELTRAPLALGRALQGE
jgi:hypothetical protein